MPKPHRDLAREQFWRQTLAILASFTATGQQFGLIPWRWLRDTLTQLPLTPVDQLAKLLPVLRPKNWARWRERVRLKGGGFSHGEAAKV